MKWSIRDGARAVGLTEQDLRTLVRLGVVPAQRIGPVWVLDEQSLEVARRVKTAQTNATAAAG